MESDRQSTDELAQELQRLRREDDRLQESSAYFSSVFTYSHDGIIVSDPERDEILDANPRACQMLGYAPAELLSLSISIIHPEEMPQLRGFAQSVFDDGFGWTDELTCLTKSGIQLPTEISASKVQLGACNCLVATIRDVSERKAAEEQLRESEARYRDLFHSAFDVNFTVDESGQLIDINRRAEELTGYSRSELLQLDVLQDLVIPEDREAARNAFQRLARGEEILFEVRWRTKQGEIIHFEGASTARQSETGEFLATRCTLRDITDRKKAEAGIQRQLKRLAAVRDIDQAITASLDLRVSLHVLLEKVTAHLAADAADVLLLNDQLKTLTFSVGRNFQTDALRHTKLRLGEGYAGRAAMQRQTVHIAELSTEAPDFFKRAPALAQEGFVAYYAVPLIAKGRVQGVLELFHRKPMDLDKERLDFLETLSGQAAIAIDNASLLEHLQRSNDELLLAYDATLAGWAKALELRDGETEGHARRVTEMTLRLARAQGVDEGHLEHMRRGALLHDIGKMGIPDRILHKPDRLTQDEWELMKQHPVYALDMLSAVEYLQPALDIPYYHHERWDGTGYPRGLQNTEIPLAARIFAVIDVYDSLISERPYKRAWSTEQALNLIQDQAGYHFDPTIAHTFLDMRDEIVASAGHPDL
jgi:PAS domain S-box-containing protein